MKMKSLHCIMSKILDQTRSLTNLLVVPFGRSGRKKQVINSWFNGDNINLNFTLIGEALKMICIEKTCPLKEKYMSFLNYSFSQKPLQFTIRNMLFSKRIL